MLNLQIVKVKKSLMRFIKLQLHGLVQNQVEGTDQRGAPFENVKVLKMDPKFSDGLYLVNNALGK